MSDERENYQLQRFHRTVNYPPQRWWGREYLSLADPERVLEELGLILDVLPQNYWLEVWDNISAEVQQQIIGQLMEVTADG